MVILTFHLSLATFQVVKENVASKVLLQYESANRFLHIISLKPTIKTVLCQLRTVIYLFHVLSGNSVLTGNDFIIQCQHRPECNASFINFIQLYCVVISLIKTQKRAAPDSKCRFRLVYIFLLSAFQRIDTFDYLETKEEVTEFATVHTLTLSLDFLFFSKVILSLNPTGVNPTCSHESCHISYRSGKFTVCCRDQNLHTGGLLPQGNRVSLE